jgi:maltose alpha-D-glucosyltransferase/alpha-amylase
MTMSTEFFAPALRSSLRQWLVSRRWFAGKARAMIRVETADLIPLPLRGRGIMLLRVEYTVGEPEIYQLPFALAEGDDAERISRDSPQAVVHRFDRGAGQTPMILADGVADPEFCRALLQLIAEGKAVASPRDLPGMLRGLAKGGGALAPWAGENLPAVMKAGAIALAPKPASADQSNSGIIYGDRLLLKLFRRVAPGVNPDLEISRFLAERGANAHVPELMGSLEHRAAQGEPLTLGVLHRFVLGAQVAWDLALERIAEYFAGLEKLTAADWPTPEGAFASGADAATVWNLGNAEPTEQAERLGGAYLAAAERLGKRTAELHVALAADRQSPQFAPEPFTDKYQQSRRWAMRDLASRTCELLSRRIEQLPEAIRPYAQSVLESEPKLLARFDALVAEPMQAMRIRCHGDYHLGQVLYANRDFTIIDFEGEPARSLEERRTKRSPLYDVAGMLRSLHYAASQGYFRERDRRPDVGGLHDRLRGAARAWQLWAVAAFLRGYRSIADATNLMPSKPAHCERLLGALLLEKAVYELAYELNNRPDWVEVPLAGVLDLLTTGGYAK